MKHIFKYIFTSIFFITLCSANISYAFKNKTTVFKERRLSFTGQMENGIAVFVGNKLISYSGDADYDFRQNADFYYLTGYDKPGAILLIVKGSENKSILFIKKPSAFSEVYNGVEPTLDEVVELYGFNEAYYSESFDDVFGKLPKSLNKIYYSFNDSEMNEKINSLFSSDYGKPEEVTDSENIIKDLRVIKSEKEIELIQKAIDITNAAHLAAMNNTKPGMNESELEALIEYTFRKNGSPRNGFQSIVGSGKNSCVLHYQINNQIIENNVTIVLDIGAEFGNYSADVTRTIPSNGKFTFEQKEIYSIVYDAQKLAIEMVKPGIPLTDVHNKTFEVIEQGLYKLGLVTDTTKNWQTKIWYPHGSSHWLGLDTHDAGDYKFRSGGRILEPGMVFTVEPGIYISENVFQLAEKLPSGFIPKDEFINFKNDVSGAFEKYKNIGVRLEDDILVTENGYINLSEKAPREIEEIEKIMNK